MSDPTVRVATVNDAELIFGLIGEFAECDGRPQRVKTNVERLRNLLTQSSPPVQFIVAEAGRVIVGFASFYRTFSTAAGESGLCLEDLYVQEASRRHGVGKLLMRFIAQVGLKTGSTKIEWTVGSDNTAGISFYESIGAPVRLKTRVCRLQPSAIKSLAAGDAITTRI